MGACVRACVFLVIVKYFPCIERFLAPCFIELLMIMLLILLNFFYLFYFYVNDEPESKFLYTETIKLYCIVL